MRIFELLTYGNDERMRLRKRRFEKIARDERERADRVPLIYRNVKHEQEAVELERQQLELEQMRTDMQRIKADTALAYADALERLAQAKATVAGV